MRSNKYKHLKSVAFNLLVIGGHSQKQVAEILEVSEPTIVNWKKTKEWKDCSDHYESCQSILKNNTEFIKSIQDTAINAKRNLFNDELDQIERLQSLIVESERRHLYGLKKLGIRLEPIR